MLTEALLTIARMWEKKEWTFDTCYNMEGHIENIMLSEISQTQRD